MTMMTEEAPATTDESADEARQQAFYVRVDQLYRLFEDWTGQKDDDDETVETKAEPSERRQSNGALVIAPTDALSTFAMFSARLAVDFELERGEFLQALGTMYDNERDQEEDEELASGASAPS